MLLFHLDATGGDVPFPEQKQIPMLPKVGIYEPRGRQRSRDEYKGICNAIRNSM